jgi:hypothetical protein
MCWLRSTISGLLVYHNISSPIGLLCFPRAAGVIKLYWVNGLERGRWLAEADCLVVSLMRSSFIITKANIECSRCVW